MTYKKKYLALLAVVVLVLPVGKAFGQASAVITLATAPKIIDTNDTTFFGAHPSEIGNWQYIFDVNVTAYNFGPAFRLENFDTNAIVNQNGGRIAAQKWSFFGTNTSNAAFRQDYGSSGSGASWVLHAGGTALGAGINNFWHAPSDYVGVAPSFGGGGWAAPSFQPTGTQSAFGTDTDFTLNFNASTTSSPVTGLIATVRIVHPNSPGALPYVVRQFGVDHTGTVLGPLASVAAAATPEPTTMGLLVTALAGMCFVAHRRRRRVGA